MAPLATPYLDDADEEIAAVEALVLHPNGIHDAVMTDSSSVSYTSISVPLNASLTIYSGNISPATSYLEVATTITSPVDSLKGCPFHQPSYN